MYLVQKFLIISSGSFGTPQNSPEAAPPLRPKTSLILTLMPGPRSQDHSHQKKLPSLNTEAPAPSSCSKQTEGEGWADFEEAEWGTSNHSSPRAHLVEVIIIKKWDIVLQLPMHGIIHLVLPLLLQLSHTLIETKITLVALKMQEGF